VRLYRLIYSKLVEWMDKIHNGERPGVFCPERLVTQLLFWASILILSILVLALLGLLTYYLYSKIKH